MTDRYAARRSAPAVHADEEGVATLVFPLLLWVTIVAAVALVDVAAYLVAGARAQQVADAAALAAVSVDAVPIGGEAHAASWTAGAGAGPHAAARRVAGAGGARLEHCSCMSGSERADVGVSLPVPGLVVPRLGARRVTATAEARLTEYWSPPGPADHRPDAPS